MKMILVSVRDGKAETWSQPYCCPNKAAAIRDFAMACQRSGTVMQSCPADFALYQVAAWDSEVGEVTSLQPVHLSNGVDHVPQN